MENLGRKRKFQQRQNHAQLVGQKYQLKKIPGKFRKVLVPIPNDFDNWEGPGNCVPIKEVFKNRIRDIEIFKGDQSEVYKVLKYILNSDTKVQKAQAKTLQTKGTLISESISFWLFPQTKNPSQLKRKRNSMYRFPYCPKN